MHSKLIPTHLRKLRELLVRKLNTSLSKKVLECASFQGMGSFILPGKRKMDTLVPDAIKNGEELEDVRKRAKLEGDLEVNDEKSLDLDGDVKM